MLADVSYSSISEISCPAIQTLWIGGTYTEASSSNQLTKKYINSNVHAVCFASNKIKLFVSLKFTNPSGLFCLLNRLT